MLSNSLCDSGQVTSLLWAPWFLHLKNVRIWLNTLKSPEPRLLTTEFYLCFLKQNRRR